MSDSNNEMIPWVLTGVATVIGALSTALVYVFRKTEFDNAKAIEKLDANNVELKAELKITSDKADKCEQDRHKLFTECAVMKNKLQDNADKISALETKLSRIDATGTKFENHRKDRE